MNKSYKLTFTVILAFALMVNMSSAFRLDLENIKTSISTGLSQINRGTHRVMASGYTQDEFEWLFDIPRIIVQYLTVLILSPLFLLPSIFLNN